MEKPKKFRRWTKTGQPPNTWPGIIPEISLQIALLPAVPASPAAGFQQDGPSK